MNDLAIWYLENAGALRGTFGEITYDDEEFKWFRIEIFTLPPLYTDYFTKLLITTPGLNGIENHKSWKFYIKNGLKRKDGNSLDHIYESNILTDKNYANLCMHLDRFEPSLDFISGDNMVDLAEAVYKFLAQK